MTEPQPPIQPTDRAAADASRARWDDLIKPRGSLGRLEEWGTWLSGAQGSSPPAPVHRPVVLLVAADHGVATAAQTSAYPSEVTAQMVRAVLRGEAAVSALARLHEARVRVVDVAVDADPAYVDDLDPAVARHRIRRASGPIDRADAMSRDEAEQALALGAALVDEEVDQGCDVLLPGDLGIGNTTAAAAIVGLLAPGEPATVTGRGTGIDDSTWMRKCGAVRDAMRRGRPVKGDPVGLLAVAGGVDLAVITGILLQAARRRTPVILDGTVVAASALVAHRMDFRSREWWMAAHLSTEPAHALALDRLDLEPALDLRMRLGEGTGALVALSLLRAGSATLREMRTFEEAGITRGAPPQAASMAPSDAATGDPDR